MDTCTICGRDGHRASRCPQGARACRAAVLLAGLLIVGPAPAVPHAQVPADVMVSLPVPITMARACNADAEGCILLPEATYRQRLAEAFELGRRSQCGSAL